MQGVGPGPGFDLAGVMSGVMLVLVRFVGLMLSFHRVSMFRLTVRSTWSTCPASRPVMLSQLLRCKVSP